MSRGLCCYIASVILAISVTGCGLDTSPKQCGTIAEAKGQAIAKKAIVRFLRYAGKTRAPISGDGGTVDAAKLARISGGELVYDGRPPTDNYAYQFHLSWAPNATFTGTIAPNCSVETNWLVK